MTSVSSFAFTVESASFKGEEDAFTLASERVGLEGGVEGFGFLFNGTLIALTNMNIQLSRVWEFSQFPCS